MGDLKVKPGLSSLDMAERFSFVLVLCGVVALVVAASMLSLILGITAAGVAAILVGICGIWVSAHLDEKESK